jgi:hypothetical protein
MRMPVADSISSDHRWLWRGGATLLVLGAAALHTLYLLHDCPLGLAPDEAHYWDWSRHLDWSYYSKGPVVALLIRGSCAVFGPLSESLTGNLALAIRLPAVLCGMLLLAGLYVLTVQSFGRERLAFGVVAIGLTLPPVAAVSTLMTIDAPYIVCWGWALVFGHLAAVRGKAWAWPVTGVIVGVGILAKYTMVLWLPSVALFLLISRPAELRRRGFWLSAAIAGVFCIPIVYWNWRHGWVTVRHVGWQAGVDQPAQWKWLGPLNYVGGQAALLLGVWFVAWVSAMWVYRPRLTGPLVLSTQHSALSTSYLWCLSLPTFVLFLLVSLKTSGQLNWPVTAYISGGVLAADWVDRRLREPKSGGRPGALVAGTAAVGLALTVIMHYPVVVRPALAKLAGPPTPLNPMPLRRFDPTCRLRGWTTLAAAVDELTAALRARGEEPVIAAGSWVLPGELGAYCSGHPTVYSLGVAAGDRASQYEFWHPNPLANPDEFRGRTFILVGCYESQMRPAFGQVESLPPLFYEEAGRPVSFWPLAVGRDFHGFPHGDELLRAARH